MGCLQSKNALEYVDDSVHVMLTKDQKASKEKGQQARGYVPRAPHPLLDSTTPAPEESTPVATDDAEGMSNNRESSEVEPALAAATTTTAPPTASSS